MPETKSNAVLLDAVFGALADPVRREILNRLDGKALLVTELAAPFRISLQAVSRHIQVLVRAGLVTQERSGRVSRCRLDAGPILQGALWLNRYSRYWQSRFDTLAMWLDSLSPSRDDRKISRPPARDGHAVRQDAAMVAGGETTGIRRRRPGARAGSHG